jgi:hypothetical protein
MSNLGNIVDIDDDDDLERTAILINENRQS